MLRVFISYRRDDSGPIAGRLFDHLAREFGDDHVFRDIYSIAPGDDFAKTIDARLRDCDVCLIIIGSRWLEPDAATKLPRLQAPGDFVRIEIETALAHKVRVIPVLVDQTKMPAEQQLPKSIGPLVRRHAAKLLDSHWEHDVKSLVETIVNGTDETDAAPGLPARLARALMPVNVAAVIGVVLELTTPLMTWAAIWGWFGNNFAWLGSIAAGLAAIGWFIVRGAQGRLAHGLSIARRQLHEWSERRWAAPVLAGLLLVLSVTIWMIPDGVTIREVSGAPSENFCERYFADSRMIEDLFQQCDGDRGACGAAAFNCTYYEVRIFTGLFSPSALDVEWRISGVRLVNGVESDVAISWADAAVDRTAYENLSLADARMIVASRSRSVPRTVKLLATWQYDKNTPPTRIETTVSVKTSMDRPRYEVTESFTHRD